MIPCDKNEPQKSTEPVKTCWFYCHKELRSYREYRQVMQFFFLKIAPIFAELLWKEKVWWQKIYGESTFSIIKWFWVGSDVTYKNFICKLEKTWKQNFPSYLKIQVSVGLELT